MDQVCRGGTPEELTLTASAKLCVMWGITHEANPKPLKPPTPCRPRYEGGLPRLPGGGVDYREDFFDKPSFLTVSGQLQVL